MRLYEYKCRECQLVFELTQTDLTPPCPNCHSTAGRFYGSVQLGAPAFQPHFNWATGQYVRTAQEFKDALKRTAENNSILTGTDHSYEPVYPDEMKDHAQFGVTGDGVDERRKYEADNPVQVKVENVPNAVSV